MFISELSTGLVLVYYIYCFFVVSALNVNDYLVQSRVLWLFWSLPQFYVPNSVVGSKGDIFMYTCMQMVCHHVCLHIFTCNSHNWFYERNWWGTLISGKSFCKVFIQKLLTKRLLRGVSLSSLYYCTGSLHTNMKHLEANLFVIWCCVNEAELNSIELNVEAKKTMTERCSSSDINSFNSFTYNPQSGIPFYTHSQTEVLQSCPHRFSSA